MNPSPRNIAAFQANYEVRSNGCWEWTASKDRDGYGFATVQGRTRKAHRLSYFLHHRKDPGRKLVLHTCDNPSCVNPEHLFLGTHKDNMADKVRKGRQCRGDAHHKRAHPENIARGEDSPRAKLTDAQVRSIRKKYPQLSQRELAALYGVSQAQIGNIVRGEQRNGREHQT